MEKNFGSINCTDNVDHGICDCICSKPNSGTTEAPVRTQKAAIAVAATDTPAAYVAGTSVAVGLSPFAVVELGVTSISASPKTGSSMPAAIGILVIGLIGAVVSGKKYFA